MKKHPLANCEKCPLRQGTFVPSEGPAQAEFAVVGEGPGWHEGQQGKPFVGISGQVLNMGLRSAGLDRSKILVLNATCCTPFHLGADKDYYLTVAAEHCKPRLEAELTERGVKKVLAVGRHAAEALGAPSGFSITQDRGVRWEYIFDTADTEFVPNVVEVMPALHPAYILRRITDKGGTAAGATGLDFVEDIRRLRRTRRPIPEVSLHLLDTVESATMYLTDVAYTTMVAHETLGEETLITLDLESDGFDPLTNRILALGITDKAGKAYVIPEKVLYAPRVLAALEQLSLAPGAAFAGHNFRFDRKFIKQQLDVDVRFSYDTMLLHWLLDERPGTHGLKTIVAQEWETTRYSDELEQVFENIKLSRKATKKRGEKAKEVTYRDIPEHVLYDYLARDIDYTHRLVDILWARVQNLDPDLIKLHEELLIPMQNVIADMELCGLPIDQDYRNEIRKTLQAQMDEAETCARKLTGNPEFNPNSAKQLGTYLFDKQRYPIVKRTPGGAPSTDEFVLKTLMRTNEFARKDPVLNAVLKYRKASKLLGTYVDGSEMIVGIDGRVRGSINPIGTVTGRPSFSSPNFGNLPRPSKDKTVPNIRKMYVAPEGYDVLVPDFSNAEVRLLAWLSGDEFLTNAFATGQDIHGLVTDFFKPGWRDLPKEEAAWWRDIGKTGNFSGVYNRFNAHAIHALLEKKDIFLPVAQVEKYMADYKKLCTGLVKWMDSITDIVDRQGYVKTLFGNRRRFGIITSDNREEAYKEAINTMAQGPACQLTWYALIEVDKWIRAKNIPAQIAMMVYDSIVILARKDVSEMVGKRVAEIMVETAYAKLGTKVPFKADVKIGPSWGEAK